MASKNSAEFCLKVMCPFSLLFLMSMQSSLNTSCNEHKEKNFTVIRGSSLLFRTPSKFLTSDRGTVSFCQKYVDQLCDWDINKENSIKTSIIKNKMLFHRMNYRACFRLLHPKFIPINFKIVNSFVWRVKRCNIR